MNLKKERESLKKQLEKQAEEYIRTNRDELSKGELKAIRLFEEGKLNESLKVRASLNSEKELEKELKNNKRAIENKSKAEKEIVNSQKSIEIHRRNLKKEADGYILKYEFDKAEEKLRALARIDSTNSNSIFKLAHYLSKNNKEIEALQLFKKSLSLKNNIFDKAAICNNLGSLYMLLNEYKNAELSYKESLEIYKNLIKIYPKNDIYNMALAYVYNNLGKFYSDVKKYELAILNFSEAQRIRESLVKKYPKKLRIELATTYNSIGVFQTRMYNFEKALENYELALKIYKRLSKTKSSEYKKDEANTFNNIGELYKYQGIYNKALENYNLALKIRENLASENSIDKNISIARVKNNIGMIYTFKKKYNIAISNYQSALLMSDSIIKLNPEKHNPFLADIKSNLGLNYLHTQNYKNSLENFVDVYHIYKDLASKSPKRYNTDLARTIILMGLLQKQRQLGKKISDFELDIYWAYEIIQKNSHIPKTKRLILVAKDLISYFESYDLLQEIVILKQRGKNLDTKDQVSILKKIAFKYNRLIKKGYEFRLSYGLTLGSIAYYQMHLSAFKEAENAAKEALNPTFQKPKNYDAEIEWVNTNLVLALLYQGKYEEAKAVYVKLKDKPYGKATYRETFLADLKELEEKGITHPNVAKIRILLKN